MNKLYVFGITIAPFVLFQCGQHKENEEQQPKPNILWITLEDTSPHFVGCYGNTAAHTPNIDRLAKEGIRFSSAYATGTVSSPSRSALITGVKTYILGTGHHGSAYPIPDFIKGYPYYLRQAGYHTANNNKTNYNISHEMEFIKRAWNESSNEADWRHRKPGQPFFSIFNYMDSHQERTMVMPEDWYKKNVLDYLKPEDIIGDNDFEMPPFYRDSPEMRHEHARVYNSLEYTDKLVGDLVDRLEKDHLKDSTIIFLFADNGEGIPRGKSNGLNLGHQVPLIIWFPEMYKHLSPWGTGNVVVDEPVDFTDFGPTVISLAGGEIPDYMKGRAFLGPKRKEPNEYVFLAHDRSGNSVDLVRSVTDGKFFYVRNFMPFFPELRYWRFGELGRITTIMRRDYQEGKLNAVQRSLFEDRPPEFLFDIKSDKWETKNLAYDSKYKPVLEKMRNALNEEILRSREIMFLPEDQLHMLSKTTTPYEFRTDTAKYPLERIYKAASLSGFRGKDIVKKQIELMKSPDKIVRVWAMIGLRAQSPEDLKPYEDVMIKSMENEYPYVEVTAVAIEYGMFGNEKAKEKMKQLIQSEDLDLANLAVNYLLYVPDRKPFIKTVQEAHKNAEKWKDDERYLIFRTGCMDFLAVEGIVPNNIDYWESYQPGYFKGSTSIKMPGNH